MFEWLKKLGNKPWQNKAGLEEKAVVLLTEDFSALEQLSPDLPAEILRYLLDGEGGEVLARLQGTQTAGETLGVVRSFSPKIKAHIESRKRFFESLHDAPPVFLIRLGLIYEAAAMAPLSNPVFKTVQRTSFLAEAGFGDPKLNWLDALLVTATGLVLNTYPRRCHACPALNAELIEAMLDLEGFGKDRLVRAAFLPPLQRFGGPVLEPVFLGLKGIAESAVRHKTVLLEILDHPDFKQRVYALDLMKKCSVPLEPFAGKLVELIASSSKLVREQTEILLVEAKPHFIPLLMEKTVTGENDERMAIARLLWRWQGESVRKFLEQCLAEEKSKKVLQGIQDLLHVPVQQIIPTAEDPLRLPELTPIPTYLPLGAETEKAWQEWFDHVNRGIAHVRTANPKNNHAKDLEPISASAIKQSFDELAEGKSGKSLKGIGAGFVFKEISAPLTTLWQRPEFQQIHLVRFLIQIGGLSPDLTDDVRHHLFGHWLENLVVAYHRAHPDASLRGFGAAFAAAGIDAARLGKDLLFRYGPARIPYGINRDKAWPYWMEHLDLLEQAFAPAGKDFMQRYYQREARTRAFDVLSAFPYPPPRLKALLWDLALGPKSERIQAQECLANASDKLERLIAALGGGSAESRFAAADWIGRLGEKSALEPLLAAFKREKTETSKGAMLAALEVLGAPVEQFLDRAGLLKEAEKGLAKGVPDDLNWFPFDQLPVAHWQDNGKKLDPLIVKWWLVQGFKLKNPEPGALLRRYCAGLKSLEREAMGQFILEAWIAEDTAAIPRDEAEKRAKAHAQSMMHAVQYWKQQAQNNPQGPTVALLQTALTQEQYYAQALPNFLKQPKGSAVASKGVLSVTGACVGAGAASTANHYLKEWYGQRAAQCRALLQMLAWVEHRTATQLLLAVGSRFRTKSIQEEANVQAQALAERKGWTVAELADRTIPSAGLDGNGVLTIDYGPRQFTAKLNKDREFLLTDGEGKILKALPDPRQDDDETKATEAKKLFSASKKELKSVLMMQRDRFYEAMCTQRTWSFDDWNLYLNRHPIVKHHCQQLVWALVRDGKTVQLFRPLADGSLTNATDDPVEPRGRDLIRVAHECQVTTEQSEAWRLHLKDYNVETMFEQFGRPNFKLSEEQQNETEIGNFQGHILEAFKLRGRANKLGYTRGQAQDGGWFFDYHKRFSTLGIEAVIEFTGNGLPEENRTVALTTLQFVRVAAECEGVGGDAKMMLSEVPAVLLSECWNDICAIGAEGSGFDADWEKKTQM